MKYEKVIAMKHGRLEAYGEKIEKPGDLHQNVILPGHEKMIPVRIQRRSLIFFIVSLSIFLGCIPPVLAEETVAGQKQLQPDTRPDAQHFGGPKSVDSTLKKDSKVKKGVLKSEDIQRQLEPYFDFKDRIKDDYGLTFGFDYNTLLQAATESLGEDATAGGVARFYGQWNAVGRDSGHPGTLVYKVENRHRLGTDVAPQSLGSELGYAGLTSVGFSDIDWALTNLFWEQRLWNGRVGLVAGIVDSTDYVGTYGLVSPWSDFSNLAFLTDPTISAPNQGLGAAASVMVTDNLYVLGGLADTNGDPTDPGNSFDSFFDQREYFTHLEFGWIPSYEWRYTDNIHLTAWHAEAREEALVPSGWGLAFSYNQLFDQKWEPFVRAGYSDDGGALWEKSVSVGLGYHIKDKRDLFALGLSWSDPSEEIFGPGLKDQYTAELFYRLRLLPNVTITPEAQLLVDPALNPDEELIALFGIRARLSF